MSLSDIYLKACDAEVPAYHRDDDQRVVRLRHPDAHASVNGSGTGSSRASSPPEYVLDPALEITFQPPRKSDSLNGVPLDTVNSPLAASRGIDSARILPDPNRQDTGVLGFLDEGKGSEDPHPTQDTKRRERDIPELSARERELRRPPSPFALLDVDPTRPKLPSRVRVVRAVRAR